MDEGITTIMNSHLQIIEKLRQDVKNSTSDEINYRKRHGTEQATDIDHQRIVRVINGCQSNTIADWASCGVLDIKHEDPDRISSDNTILDSYDFSGADRFDTNNDSDHDYPETHIKCERKTHNGLPSDVYLDHNHIETDLENEVNSSLENCATNSVSDDQASCSTSLNSSSVIRPIVIKPEMEDYTLDHSNDSESQHVEQDRPFECPTCDKTFTQARYLKMHLKTHSGERPHQCTLCGKGFIEYYKLQLHMRSHTGERPFKCSICGKGFTHPSKVKIHARSHTGDKPYKCSECNRCFTQCSNLTRHMKMHTGEKPFVCAFCSKGFVEYNKLQQHMKSHDAKIS